jgi:hypothetical protein
MPAFRIAGFARDPSELTGRAEGVETTLYGRPARYTCPGSSRPRTDSSQVATSINASRSTPDSTPSPSSR